MKTSSLLTALALFCTLGSASAATIAQPKLVRVALGPQLTVEDLLRAGLDVVSVKETEARVLEWPGDAARLARLRTATEVLDENPGRTAARRTEAEMRVRPAPPTSRVRSATEPDGVFRIQGLPAFGSGSMGGYWITDEIKMKLDQLVASDVDDVVADKLDTLGYTVMNRPIWGLKLGKRVEGPDSRPVAFFNSLTHAREPEGMQALFYFVDDILSNYGTDPFATYLLDQRVIYIVPLVNPDGYRANEDTYTGTMSFGFWRKNARDNNGNLIFDSGDGVDLNRNYSFQWGFDNSGSSPTPADETYRGPAALSEPETQAQRNIVVQLAPKTGYSFHTYSDLALHPWGYVNATTPHEPAFKEWSDELSRENAYLTGNAPRILYSVNGEFNDWCYGDTTSKPRMFSWTPEVGDAVDGFWPPPSRILPLARENLRSCYVITAIAGPFVQEDGVTLLEGAMNAGNATQVVVRARNLGSSGVAGPGLSGTMVPLDAGAAMMVPTVAYPDLGPRTSGSPASPFYVAIADTVTPGRLMRFELRFTTPGGFFSRDTVVIPVGTPTVLASDDASSGLGKWTTGGSPSTGTWTIIANNLDHPSRFFADSPSFYGSLWNTDLRLTTPATLDLSAGVHAYVLYDARWEFEEDWDAGCIEASFNGTTWVRLQATGTTPGSGLSGAQSQPAGVPVYAGSRRNWKSEIADLSPFTGAAGTAVRVRFRTRSDGGTGFDGFSFDSFRVVVYDPAAQPAPVAVGDGLTPNALELAPPAPNPVRHLARFGFALPRAGTVRLEILDLQGRRVRTLANGHLQANRYVRGWDLRDERGNAAPPGIYLARLSATEVTVVRRFAVLR